MPLVRNPDAAWSDRYTFFHAGRWAKAGASGNFGKGDPNPDSHKLSRSAIRSERWRLVQGTQLYDLENDPGERVNLVDHPEHAEVQADLNQRLMTWMAAEGDYLLHAQHLLPAGSYCDGRGFNQQHDPGVWSEAEKAWFVSGMETKKENQ